MTVMCCYRKCRPSRVDKNKQTIESSSTPLVFYWRLFLKSLPKEDAALSGRICDSDG